MEISRLTREQIDYLEISSVLENAPYLFNEGRELSYVGSGKSKSGTCNCSSSKFFWGNLQSVKFEKFV